MQPCSPSSAQLKVVILAISGSASHYMLSFLNMCTMMAFPGIYPPDQFDIQATCTVVSRVSAHGRSTITPRFSVYWALTQDTGRLPCVKIEIGGADCVGVTTTKHVRVEHGIWFELYIEHTHAFQCLLRSISELLVYKSTRKEKSLGTVDLSEKLVV